MANQFFILVDKQDSEKFRQFRVKQFNAETQKILEKNNMNLVWGLHKGIISKTIWDKIRKNDKVFFTLPKENFKIYGIVSKKLINLNFGKLFYPGDLNSKQINYFIFFEKLEECSISYHELIHNSKLQIYVEQGIHEIKKEYYSENKKKERYKKFNPQEKIIGKSKRSKSEVWRYVRNTGKVKELKNLYHNKCQICSDTFQYDTVRGNSEFYSEVHHYDPLKNQADDDFGNMIVVCPNHHAKFDYSFIRIHSDGRSIINQQGKLTGEEISFHKYHTLEKKNIESQL